MDKDITHIQQNTISHKKEQNKATCSNMDATRNYHIHEVSQGKTNIYYLYVEPKK